MFRIGKNKKQQLLLGEWLVTHGVIQKEDLKAALRVQKKWNVPLGQVLVSQGRLKSFELAQNLAENLSLPFVNFLENPPEKEYLKGEDAEFYAHELIIPWRQIGGILWVATADPNEKSYQKIYKKYGEDAKIAVCSKFDVIWMLHRHFSELNTSHSIMKIMKNRPHQSAHVIITWPQITVFVLIFVVVAFFLWYRLSITLLAGCFLLSLFYCISFIFRAYLGLKGLDYNETMLEDEEINSELAKQTSENLPTYTVLVPLYKEGPILPYFVDGMRKLDYPRAKLDIKILLEENDPETIQIAKDLHLEDYFEIIIVPESHPQTKPKAINYGLEFARGEFLVIYDAEDRPEPDQLRKAAACFNLFGEKVVCLQARLNFYNSHENWLSRLFTIEYSSWFDYMLPGLDIIGVPIPLGGTSCHFRTDKIIELHGWDPHNVTEDADLGIRIAAEGYQVRTLHSTTYEEANFKIPSWIRQRSRWVKGFMVTWLVHMRHPWTLHKNLGAKAFWGFQLFFGGSTFVSLVNPFLWILFLLTFFDQDRYLAYYFSGIIGTISFINIILGNGCALYIGFIAPAHRKLRSLSLYGFLMPIYWVLLSIAAYRALWGLLVKPHYWHKTAHGVSGHFQSKKVLP